MATPVLFPAAAMQAFGTLRSERDLSIPDRLTTWLLSLFNHIGLSLAVQGGKVRYRELAGDLLIHMGWEQGCLTQSSSAGFHGHMHAAATTLLCLHLHMHHRYDMMPTSAQLLLPDMHLSH